MGTIPFILFAVSLVAYLKASGVESLVSKALVFNSLIKSTMLPFKLGTKRS